MPRGIRELSGQRYGRLVVIEMSQIRNKHAFWKCKCDCGNYKTISSAHLVSGCTTSCGCYQKEQNRRPRPERRKNTIRRENGKKTKIYRIYTAIIERCYNKNNKSYNNYGGRGISVAQEWKDSFEAFYKWIIENGYREGLTIDRINVDGDYSPDNCRLADFTTQALNKRVSKKNKTGYTGTCQSNNRYIAYIGVGKKHIHLGTYETLKETVAVRDKAEKIAEAYKGFGKDWGECANKIVEAVRE